MQTKTTSSDRKELKKKEKHEDKSAEKSKNKKDEELKKTEPNEKKKDTIEENSEEKWKIMKDFEENCEVSDQGRVKKDGKIVKQFERTSYLSVRLKSIRSKKRKFYYVHRLVCQHFIGKCPNGMVVNHLDGKKNNNKLINLVYVTLSQNTLHALDTGLLKLKTKQVEIEEDDGEIVILDSVKEAALYLGIGVRQLNDKLRDKDSGVRYVINEKTDISEVDGEQYKNYDNYLITKDGRVYSIKSGKYLKLIKHHSGYINVNLQKGKKIKKFSVHRLVAEVYLKKPKGCNIVNHLDRNRSNNHVSNLEWTTLSGNAKHACKTKKTFTRKVYQIDVSTNKIKKEYPSIAEAGRSVGITGSSITKVCKGVRDTAGGYDWKYVD